MYAQLYVCMHALPYITTQICTGVCVCVCVHKSETFVWQCHLHETK